MLRVGLTGGIGSGKTEAARYFEQLGVPVLYADDIAKAQYQKPSVQTALQNQFQTPLFTAEGDLDKQALRNLIYSDQHAKQVIEQLIHPLVRQDIAEHLNSLDMPYAVIEIPLLIETLPNPLIDRILVVLADSDTRLQRVCQRDSLDATMATTIMQQQSTDEAKRSHADDILINNSTIEHLHTSIEQLHQQYLDLSRQG